MGCNNYKITMEVVGDGPYGYNETYTIYERYDRSNDYVRYYDNNGDYLSLMGSDNYIDCIKFILADINEEDFGKRLEVHDSYYKTLISGWVTIEWCKYDEWKEKIGNNY